MFFWEKDQKCVWGQPARQCALSCEFSGKVVFLNLSCCWWGIHEMWAVAQRLHVKKYGAFTAHQSDWFYQNHLYPFSGGQESYIFKCLPYWEAEWDIKPHKLKKGYCPCTSPFYFLVVLPAIQLCSDHEHDATVWVFSHLQVEAKEGKAPWASDIKGRDGP